MTGFSLQVKNDLAGLKTAGRCCQLAELSAIIRMDGSLRLSHSQGMTLELVTASAAIARKVIKLLHELFGLRAEATARRSRLSGVVTYLVHVAGQRHFQQALNELGILDESLNIRSGVAARLVKKRCCAACYLRGLFLGGGYISTPGKPHHFELAIDNQSVAEEAIKLLSRFDVTAKLIARKRNWAVYLKNQASIANVLAVIGAYSALLEWEAVAILKTVKASTNRLVNCDTANVAKSVRATSRQIEAIHAIDSDTGLQALPPALEQAALLRLRYPQATIEELGRRFSPELSKSAVYHRLRRLMRIAATSERAQVPKRH